METCRACARGDHHRCRRGACGCEFPVHTPGSPLKRHAPLVASSQWRERSDATTSDAIADVARSIHPRMRLAAGRPRKPKTTTTPPEPTPVPRPIILAMVTPGTILVPLDPCAPVVTRVLPPPPPRGRRYRDRQDPARRVVAGRLLVRKAKERAARQHSEMFVEAAVRLLDENDWNAAAVRLLLSVVEADGGWDATEPPVEGGSSATGGSVEDANALPRAADHVAVPLGRHRLVVDA